MIIEKKDLLLSLQKVVDQLEPNLPILIHSDISKVGIIDKIKSPNEMGQDYEDVFDEVFHSRPYLIPTFNYNFCKTGTYDLSKDFGQVGAL